MTRSRASAKQAGTRWGSAIVDSSPAGACRMIRLILALALAAATLAAVLLSMVLLPSAATDYPEGNIHE